MKIGIITMHRVLNYGSALQAYALQKYIEQTTNADVYIIDYFFPNHYHKSNATIKKIIRNILGVSHDYLVGGRFRRICRFNDFYHSFLKLSSRKYHSPQSLMEFPPEADIFITGSDQVWNINTMKNDGAFYLNFVPLDKRKISFGSSFSVIDIPISYHNQIKEYLSTYSAIGMRESSGCDFIRTLNLSPQIEIKNTCDPTLLLSAEDYHEISLRSNLRIDGDFILVYLLNYSFDPRPAITDATRFAAKFFNCKVVLIGANHLSYDGEVVYKNNFGPSEFCWLFENAKYVITSSFHGTMFSIIYRKPFVSIVPFEGKDSRQIDLLAKLGLNKFAWPSNKKIDETIFDSPYSEEVENNISLFLQESQEFLRRNISNE